MNSNKIILNSDNISLIKNNVDENILNDFETDTIDENKFNNINFNIDNNINIINYFLDKNGEVPRFVQEVVLQNLNLILTQEKLECKTSFKEANDKIRHILFFIEDSVISDSQGKYGKNNTSLAFYHKYNNRNYEYHKDNVIVKINNYGIDNLKYHNLYVTNIEEKEDCLHFYGFFSSLADSSHFTINAVKCNYYTNKEEVYTGKHVKDKSLQNTKTLSKDWEFKYTFLIKVPFTCKEQSIIRLRINFHKDKDLLNTNENNLISFYPNIRLPYKLSPSPNFLFNTTNHSIRLIENEFFVSKNYLFSIVIALYNTGKYLYESIDSVINQTLDFEDNIQLILVDDGSTDDSLDICLEYQEKYPENIVVLSQENGGQASARNHGLKYATGRYVNFLDSDDYISSNTLEEVNKLFEQNYKYIDLVSIPIKLFGRKEKDHVLNSKFNKTRVINLRKEPNNPQLSISSAFVKNSVIKEYKFNTELVSSEDTLIINKILFEKKNYGILDNAFYYYRQRIDSSSTTDNVASRKEYYTPRLKNHFMELINYSIEKQGYIPNYIQYLLAYNIQWMLNQNISCIDSEDEKEEFWKYLREVLSYIGDEKVLKNKHFKSALKKNFFLFVKYGKKFDTEYKTDSVYLKAGHHILDKLHNHKFWLDIVEMDDNHLKISGSLNSLFDNDYISIEAVTESDDNVQIIRAEKTFYTSRQNIEYLSIPWQYKFTFDLDIPLDSFSESVTKLRVNYHKNKDNNDFSEDNIISSYLIIDMRKFAKISKISNYIVNDSRILEIRNNEFHVFPYEYSKMFNLERGVIKKIKDRKSRGYKDALKLRRLYLLLYPLKNKPLYLFMDRTNQADDNAEHLFKYALKQDDDIKKVFVINKDSPDKSRLSKYGEIVGYNSFKHRLYFLLADKVISSHPDETTLNPFFSKKKSLNENNNYAGLITAKRYYIRHGVTKDNMSTWLRKFDKNLALVLTSSDYERESFIDSGYNYDPSIVQALGLPRFDNLINDNKKKQILFIPTWRQNMADKEVFMNSDFFKSLNDLLSDEKLIDLLDKHGYEFVFKGHPNIEKQIKDSDERYIDLFDINSKVKVSTGESYQELFNESSLLITDYSSVFFDFAYLKKPVIYYRPNDDYHFKEGYFNWETMGFGDVIEDKITLFNKLEDYLINECIMEEKYKNRVDNFFKYTDKNNCERVYNWIKEN